MNNGLMNKTKERDQRKLILPELIRQTGQTESRKKKKKKKDQIVSCLQKAQNSYFSDA